MLDWLNNLNELHFIRPWAWLLLIPALTLFLWQVTREQSSSNWAKLIDQHLLQWLMPHSEKSSKRIMRQWLLLSFWLIAIAALSGPSWQQLPQPIFSSTKANVLLLDLSRSMDADDIKPSRLLRAKYKASDLFESLKDGQTGLVVYAGDAFTLSPLTSDRKTIENLLQPLSTDLMPVLGSQPQKGIAKAIQLLTNAGQAGGNIFWFTDGAETNQLAEIESLLASTNYQLKILAFGSKQGAPIPTSAGPFLKDRQGNVVVPKLDYNKLAHFADKLGASLTGLTSDNSDIELLTQVSFRPSQDSFEQEDMFADSWQDAGYWLLLLLLPIALFSFKYKNLLAIVLLSLGINALPVAIPSAKADPLDKLFLNRDQQGKKQFEQQDFEQAQKAFKDPNWKAIAAYKNGDYESSIENLKAAETADEHYNLGNALALNEQYQAALENYNKAIELQPDNQDAIYNKKIIEQLLEQKKQQESQDKDKQDDNQQQNSQEQQQDQQQEQDQEQSQDQEQQDEQEQQQNEQQTEQEKQQQQLEQTSEQEKEQELEQWLKRISDDPGRLLRNKMKLEYNRRGHRSQPTKTW